jgi:hypothetical protein
MCKGLEPEAKDLNLAIGEMVKKGLPATIQQSLDIVRVTGNGAIHADQIDVDSPEVVAQLFALVNLIGEYMISMPKKVSNLYSSLPKGARDQIERRGHSYLLPRGEDDHRLVSIFRLSG